MACSSCGQKRVASPQRTQEIRNRLSNNPEILIAPKSEDSTKVRLRYYGGKMTRQTSGCSSCGSQGKYALTTSETISFVSEDAPNSWFSQMFDVGKDYYVTQKQAERLLQETFTNPAGQIVHKFKVIEQANLLCYNVTMKVIVDIFIAALIIFGIVYLAGIHPTLGWVSSGVVAFRLGVNVRKAVDEKEEHD